MPETHVFDVVTRLLTQELGFRARAVADSHVVFERPDGVQILLNPEAGALPARQLAYLRDTLDLHGLLSKSKFYGSLTAAKKALLLETRAKPVKVLGVRRTRRYGLSSQKRRPTMWVVPKAKQTRGTRPIQPRSEE
jgi:hypothetical protein